MLLATGPCQAAVSDFELVREAAARGGVESPEAVIEERRLAPSGFLSAGYDLAFLEWMERSVWPRWGGPAQERYGWVEIASGENEGYTVKVVAEPILEAWYPAEPVGGRSRYLIAAGGSGKRGAWLHVIRRTGKTTLFSFPPIPIGTGTHSLHYLWKPELHDLDADGTPEIWVRYNLLWGNGFKQVLDIFKLIEGQVLLYKSFVGENEGVARRLPDGRIETGRGAPSRVALPHFEYDLYKMETWQYRKGSFIKIAHRTIPHPLRSKDWQKYI